MWSCTPQLLDNGKVQRFVPQYASKPLRYREVLRLWQNDEMFRSFFLSLLSNTNLSGYRWETLPITKQKADREFEFVLIDTPAINRPPDPTAFAEQFERAPPDPNVVAFPNLGNDAVLIAPKPQGPNTDYVHLAAFVRSTHTAQQHELCRVIGATMEARLSDKPTWLSTAGMGVAWLHVRLDSSPKYYGFSNYKIAK